MYNNTCSLLAASVNLNLSFALYNLLLYQPTLYCTCTSTCRHVVAVAAAAKSQFLQVAAASCNIYVAQIGGDVDDLLFSKNLIHQCIY